MIKGIVWPVCIATVDTVFVRTLPEPGAQR